MSATSWRGLAAAALATVCLLTAGCGDSSSPLQHYADAQRRCVDLLTTITDPASASAVVDKLKPTFTEFDEAVNAIAALGQDVGSKAQLHKLEPIITRGEREFTEQMTRLNALKGLPAEFWNPFRVELYRLVQAKASLSNSSLSQAAGEGIGRIAALVEQHGPERTIEIKLTNATAGNKDAAVKRINEIAGPASQVVDFQDPSDAEAWLVAVAPVQDFDALVAAVDFGKVVEQEKAKYEATIELAASADPPAAAETVVVEDAPPTEVAAEVVANEDLSRRESPASPDAAPESAESAEADEGRELSKLELYLLSLANLRNKIADMAPNGAALAPGGAAPGTGDPNQIAQLAESLFDAQAPLHETAVMTLLTIRPQDVADKKVRGRIAQGYKHIAFETTAHPAEGVKGLVLWGGKFSAPLLIELLEKGTAGADEAIYEGLGAIGTAEAADAVVGRMGTAGSATNSETAMACLRKMGAVAEAPLIGALPFETPEANRAAIELLGDIGTRKSNAILRQATKSENEEVAAAALEAIRKIQERQRAAKTSE